MTQQTPNFAQSLIGGFEQGQTANFNRQFQPLQLQQAQMQTQQLQDQQNIQNTIRNLTKLEGQIESGMSEGQILQDLQQQRQEILNRGGNPADTEQALQTLQEGGLPALQQFMDAGRTQFERAGLLNPVGVAAGGAAEFTNIQTDPNTGISTGFNKSTGMIEVIPAQKQASTALEEQAQANREAAEAKRKAEEQSNTFTQTQSLRKEFEAEVKPYRQTIEAFGGLESILDADEEVISGFADRFAANAAEGVNREQIVNDARAISDIALIFSFFKTVDPQSTVREGEFATLENAGSVDTRFRNLYNKLLRGEKLNDAQRNQIIRIAQNRRNRAADRILSQREKYGTLASRQELDPSLVIYGKGPEAGIDRTQQTTQPPQAQLGQPAAPSADLSGMSDEEILSLIQGQ